MDILASLHPILKRCLTPYVDNPIPITLKIQILQMLFLVNNNDMHLMIISEYVKEFLVDQKA